MDAIGAYPGYAFNSRSISVPGAVMHFVDEGPKKGPPVLCLHGNPSWSYYYRRVIGALAGNCRVIVPDHVGMGLSEKPTEKDYAFTLTRRVADIELLVDSLELGQPMTLVVHDWGGMIGMAYAVRHPEKIGKIVVLNTGGFRLPVGKRMPWQLTLARMPFIGAVLVRGFNAFARGAVKNCVMTPMPAAVGQAFLAPYDSWQNRLAVHRFIQDIPLKPGDRAYELVRETEEKLGSLRQVPMLICWGMRDFVFDDHFLKRWQELFPAAAVHRFEKAGHYVLEDAHEEILPLIQRFVGAVPAEARG